ncbi:MAG: Ig-like domain-containing protein [Calditrichia bacterium]|nr:Ig-like domain-containing protein [Calditrichia bacterium]
MRLNNVNIIFLFLLSIALFKNCAVRKAPGGGPKDEEAPQIINTYPEANTLNIDHLEYFLFEFSEPVKKNSIKKAFRISPPLKIKEKFKWESDRRLRIIIEDTLKEHTTYALTLGTEAKDWHENSLLEPYVLPFSTDSIIHSGKISGRILNQKKGDNISLNIYNLNKINAADTVWYSIPPDLISTTHTNGSFRINYIKPGNYRLLAYIDQDFSKGFSPYNDAGAVFHKDVTLVNAEDSVINMYTKMIKMDTSKAGINKIEMVNPGELEITFSRPLTVSNIHIQSLAEKKRNLIIRILWKSSNRETEISNFYLQNTVDEDSLNILIKVADGIRQKEFLFQPGEKDTIVKPKLTFKPPEILYFEDSLKVKLNNPIDTSTFKKSVALLLKKQSIPISFQWNDFKNIQLFPLGGWKFEGEYAIEINYNILRDYWGQTFKDTLISYNFTIISEDDLGGIAGSFTNNWPAPEVIFELNNLDKKKKYQRKLKQNELSTKSFEIENLPGGKYTFNGWYEAIPDEKWNHGNFLPFSFCEPLFWTSDTVRVRVRWVKEGVKINNE